MSGFVIVGRGDPETHGEIVGAGNAGRDTEWTSAPGFWSTIGDRTLNHPACGDGYDECQIHDGDDSWTVWYRRRSQSWPGCSPITTTTPTSWDSGR